MNNYLNTYNNHTLELVTTEIMPAPCWGVRVSRLMCLNWTPTHRRVGCSRFRACAGVLGVLEVKHLPHRRAERVKLVDRVDRVEHVAVGLAPKQKVFLVRHNRQHTAKTASMHVDFWARGKKTSTDIF